jgi:Tfp pilus assembly PilM family ATPase
MKNASEIYGAAMLGGKLYAVRTEHDGARRRVTALMTSDDNLNGNTLDSGRLFFAVDGPLAVVKKITVRQNNNIQASDIAEFELAQSLLESAERFYFDTFPMNAHDGFRQFLAVAYHKNQVDHLIEFYQASLRKPSGFKLDAVALADGFKAFCRSEPGDLHVVVDIENDRTILAILYRERLCAVDRLESALGTDVSSTTARKFAAELKLKLSFHLSELFQDGITVPLSRIVLAGRHARDQLLTAALGEYFTTAIVLPQFHAGYFQPASATLERHHPEEFLIPLGLAVE